MAGCRFILPRACSRRGGSADPAQRGQHDAKATKCRSRCAGSALQRRSTRPASRSRRVGKAAARHGGPHSKALQLTILAYLLPPVKRHRVHFGPAREAYAPPPGVIRAEEWQWSSMHDYGGDREQPLSPIALWPAIVYCCRPTNGDEFEGKPLRGTRRQIVSVRMLVRVTVQKKGLTTNSPGIKSTPEREYSGTRRSQRDGSRPCSVPPTTAILPYSGHSTNVHCLTQKQSGGSQTQQERIA